MQKWRHSILVVYLVVLSILTTYSIAAIPNFHRIRRFVPGSSWFVSDRPELDGDFRTYLAAGFLVIVLNVVMTDFSVVPILLGFVVFYVCEVYFSRVSMGWNLGLTSVVFAFLIPMYMTPTETARTFWQILMFFLFVYALSIVRVHVANQ